MSLRRRTAAFLAALVLAAMVPVAGHGDEREQDEIRRSVERGEIRSLADILSVIRDRLPGEVAGVEVEREGGRWLYEFRVVDGKGRLFEVYVDARSAKIESIKEK